MQDFFFQNDTRIFFGRGVEDKAGEECAKITKKVLLHYGGGSIMKTGLYGRVKSSLEAAGLTVFELGGVKPNPRVELVREGIGLCRRENIGLVLAVGGGSVIDSAKGIAAGWGYPGDVWDLYADKAPVPDKILPTGVVLTLPAAGSETSGSSVVTNEDGWWKRHIGANHLRPRFCLLNPELTMTLPPYQTACGVSDMLAHVMERYFTTEKKTDLTDRLCEGVMKTIIAQAPKVMADPRNYDARAEIMWCGTVAHNDLLDTGRIGDWSTHGIEHEVSGIYDLAHGAGLAILFPAWLKLQRRRDPGRIEQFARRVFGIDAADAEEAVDAGIVALETFFRSIGMPGTLSEAGIGDDRFAEMADKATSGGTRTMGNYVPLTRGDVLEIFNLAK